jgi:hypothetical protein
VLPPVQGFLGAEPWAGFGQSFVFAVALCPVVEAVVGDDPLLVVNEPGEEVLTGLEE